MFYVTPQIEARNDLFFCLKKLCLQRLRLHMEVWDDSGYINQKSISLLQEEWKGIISVLEEVFFFFCDDVAA